MVRKVRIMFTKYEFSNKLMASVMKPRHSDLFVVSIHERQDAIDATNPWKLVATFTDCDFIAVHDLLCQTYDVDRFIFRDDLPGNGKLLAKAVKRMERAHRKNSKDKDSIAFHMALKRAKL